MSRLEAWLDAQTRTVQAGGELAEWITLEGPDGSVWGTWKVEREKLAALQATIRTALELVGEELATGRHQCKLIALDGDRRQIALMPYMMTGRSAVAASAATEQKVMQQALQIAVGNFEAQTLGLRQENERLRKRNEELEERMAQSLEAQLKIQQAVVEMTVDIEAKRANQRRLDEILETSKPLLEVGMGLAGEWMYARLEEQKKRQQDAHDAKTAAKRKAEQAAANAGELAGTAVPKASETDGGRPDAKPSTGNDSPSSDQPGGAETANEQSPPSPDRNGTARNGRGGDDGRPVRKRAGGRNRPAATKRKKVSKQ